MVGAVRFELTTSWTRTKRASQATLRPEPGGRRCLLSGRIATLIFPSNWISSKTICEIHLSIAQNLRTPRKFFLLVLVLVLVLDRVSGLDYEDEDDDDSAAAAPLRNTIHKSFLSLSTFLGSESGELFSTGLECSQQRRNYASTFPNQLRVSA